MDQNIEVREFTKGKISIRDIQDQYMKENLAILLDDGGHVDALVFPFQLERGFDQVRRYQVLQCGFSPTFAAPAGFPGRWLWLDIGCLAFMGGVLAKVFVSHTLSAPAYPIKDPRLMEAMGLQHPVTMQISEGELDTAESLADGRDLENDSS
jgi:hypothetical protein